VTIPHIARYLARVDAHLPTLPDDGARVAFLNNEMSKWDARYENFGARVEAGAKVDPDVQAADFIVTIADLRTRANQYQPKVAA
jgi:hypothetical protein